MDLFSRLSPDKNLSEGASSGLSCPHTAPYVILNAALTGTEPAQVARLSVIKYHADGTPVGLFYTDLEEGGTAGAPSAQQIQRSFLTFLSDCLVVGCDIVPALHALNALFHNAFHGRNYVELTGFRPTGDLLADCEGMAALLRQEKVNLSALLAVFPDGAKAEAVPADPSDGREAWASGEKERLAGNNDQAIALFDRARELGYTAPALYESYAKLYRKGKDYQQEAAILEEGMARQTDPAAADKLKARRDRALELLHGQQAKPRKAGARPVAQCDEEGVVIRTFDSVAAAAAEVGIGASSIRSAANGKQKRAGGFCWKYTDN